MNTQTIPVRGDGHFQWNTGGWYGSQIGSTAWLVMMGIVLVSTSHVTIGVVLILCGLLPNLIGYALWKRRDRIRPYPAIQLLIGVVFAFTLVAVLATELIDSPLTLDSRFGTGRQTYSVLAIFPALMIWFAWIERMAKKRNT